MRALFVVLLFAIGFVSGHGPAGAAGSTGQSCLLPPLKLPDAEVLAFIDNPASLLRDAKGSGEERLRGIEKRARRLVGSGTESLEAISKIIPTASEDEKKAIGRALGMVAVVCAATKPEVGLAIQSFVAKLDDAFVVTAFLARSNDTDVASINGIGPAGGIVVGSIGGNFGAATGSETRSRPIGITAAAFGAAGFSRVATSSSSRSRP